MVALYNSFIQIWFLFHIVLATNKTLIPELNGVNAMISIIETSQDESVVQSNICALCTLSTGNKKNMESIALKCPLKPLVDTLIHLLKPSDKELNASISVKTMPIHEPEFVNMLEKTLLIMQLVCSKGCGSSSGARTEEINQLNSDMNLVELLLSLLCFLHATEHRHSRVDHCFNIIVNILSQLCSDEKTRQFLISQMNTEKPMTEDHFYVLVQGKQMNGAKLILNQFMSSNLTFASELSLFLAKMAEYEPKAIVAVVDKLHGKDSFFVKCLSFLKSTSVADETRMHVAQLLSNIFSNGEMMGTLAPVIKNDLTSTMTVLLTELKSALQTAGFYIMRHMNLNDGDLVNNCLQYLTNNVPSCRIIEWMLQLDHTSESNHKILFILLETLKNHVAMEKTSGDEVAYLGLTPLLVNLLKTDLFKEIVLLLIHRLAKSCELRDAFVHMGGMNVIVPMLSDRTKDYFLDVVTIINRMCDKSRLSQVAVAELGGLRLLIQILRTDNNEPESSSKIAECDPLYDPSCKIRLMVTSCLKNLLECSDNVTCATNYGAVEALLPYCDSPSCAMVENVVTSVLYLSNIYANREQIAQCSSLIDLLDCEHSSIQEIVCNILSNVSMSSQCQEILLQNGAYSKLQNQLESDNQLLSLYAQMALNHFKHLDVGSLKRRALELIKNSKIDFEQKKKDIETQYVRKYEAMINRGSMKASSKLSAYDSLLIEVNWTFFDTIPTDDQKRSALHLLKQNMWDNLRKSIGTYCDQSIHHSQALLQAVKRIVVQFAAISSVQYEPASKEHTSSAHSLNDGTLYYNVGFDSMSSMPVDEFVSHLNDLFMAMIKMFKRQSTMSPKDTESMISVPRSDVLSNALENPIQVLEKLARDAVNGPLQLQAVINLVSNEPYDRLSEHDSEAVERIKQQVLLFEEKFIKAYKVIKINKDGLKQERFLILTDKSYYTVKYDFAKKEHDKKHSKRYNLRDLFVIDVGLFEKTDDKFFLNLYMKQKMTKSRTYSVAKRLSNQSLISVDLFDENAQFEFAQLRPNTDTCNYNLLTPPYTNDHDYMTSTKLQGEKAISKRNLQLMQEIAWVLYASSVHLNGSAIWAPFNDQVLQKPSSKLTSLIYNKFKFGKL